MRIAKNKKGQVLQDLGGIAIGIATFTIIIAVAFLVMAQTKAQDASVTGLTCNSTSGSVGCNATGTLQNATQDIPGWVPLIVIVVIGGTILGMVKTFGVQ